MELQYPRRRPRNLGQVICPQRDARARGASRGRVPVREEPRRLRRRILGRVEGLGRRHAQKALNTRITSRRQSQAEEIVQRLVIFPGGAWPIGASPAMSTTRPSGAKFSTAE